MFISRLKKTSSFLAVFFLGILLGCGTMISCSNNDDDSDNPPKTAAISIFSTATQMEATGTITLTAILVPSNSAEGVTWTATAGANSVTLNKTTGSQITVTGKNTAADDAFVNISATSGSKTASTTITVKGNTNQDSALSQNPAVTIWTGTSGLAWSLGNSNGSSIAKEKFNTSAIALKFYFSTAASEGSLKVMSQKDWTDRTMSSASGDGYLVTDGSDANKMVKLESGKTGGSILIKYSPQIMEEFSCYGIKFCGDAATILRVELIYGESSISQITNWTLVNDFSSSTIDPAWTTASWANGGMFGCGWAANHITFNDSGNGLMKIRLDDTRFNDSLNYTGGELRTNSTYGYGYYEVRMKPCKKEGTNSSFFLYTETRSGNALTAWNEIDIEFLGKNTNQVQFNYFVDKDGEGHEYLLQDLGFDASQDFHTYGIEYAPTHIKWYVDGRLVHTATGCTKSGHHHATGTLPNKNMQIMTNFWNGNNSSDMKAWLGTFTYSGPLYAEYDYIKYKSAD